MLFVAGCAADTEEIALPYDPPAAFSDSGDDAMPMRWWQAFNDDGLNQRIENALSGNLSLASAWQRLQAARAVADRAGSDFFPDIDGSFQGERRSGATTLDFGGQQFSVGLNANYEVDLWGRINALAEAERYRAEASLADYRTAALTLSAEITRVWYQRVEAKQQRDLLQAQLEANRQVQRLLQARFSSGLIRSADILRQEQLVEQTRAQRIAAEERLQLRSHQLAVLQGKPPKAESAAPSTDLPDLPPMPDTGIPGDLIQRRPDVRRDWLQVQAANQEVAAAISNRYPRLSLSGAFFTEGEELNVLFSQFLNNVAGSLTAPIFDAGERAADLNRTRAIEKEQIKAYADTVLTALREVEDALVQERKQGERLASLEKQVTLARQAYRRLRSEYYNGIAEYTGVLNALTDLQSLQRDALQAQLAQIEARIALYRALAGGFDTGRDSREKST